MEKKKIRLAIFDLDGTVLDTLESLGSCVNSLLEERGYKTHEMNSYKHFVGSGAFKLIERAVGDVSVAKEELEAITACFITRYDACVLEKVYPYEGIIKVLETLQEKGISLAVVTNKPHEQAVKLVAHYLKGINFIAVQGNLPHLPHKPNPFVVNQVIAEQEVAKEEVFYIGDSDVDMQTANCSEVVGIGVSWGFRSKEELMANGASCVIDTPEQLLEYIL